MIRHNYDLDLKKKLLQKKKIIKKKLFTDRRTTQNYSSELHKKVKPNQVRKNFYHLLRYLPDFTLFYDL